MSASSSRLTWFASENGKKWVLTGITCAGGGLLFANIVPHTFLLKKYKEIVQMYRLGQDVPVSPHVLNLVDQVIDDMGIPPSDRKLIVPFTVFGFDVFRAGSTTSKFGAIIGIPSSFAYDSPKDVNRQQILVKNETLNWDSEHATNLQSSLVLSENAKKFAIGREIASAETIQPYLNGIYPITVLLFIYSFTHSLNKRMQLFARPLALRGLLYSITGFFGVGTWAFLKDFSTVHYETKADKEMCKLGVDYIKGGMEFYSKTLQRNIALRNLMGKEGESLYSVSGNESFFIRQKRMPIGHRKLYLELRLKEFLDPTKDVSNNVSLESAHSL